MSNPREKTYPLHGTPVSARQHDLGCLNIFQQQLQSIYEVNVPHLVSDFVISDQQAVSRLTNGDKDHLREKLLVRQDGEDIDLSLYLHTDVINTMIELTAEDRLEPEHIEHLCLAVEGISHFLYLIWRALQRHNVSLLELELQAEVDKYILILFFLKRLNKYGLVSRLRKILFENVRFDDTLDEMELFRYREANNHAARYCQLLETRYPDCLDSKNLVCELRKFYRLGQNAKLNRINNLDW